MLKVIQLLAQLAPAVMFLQPQGALKRTPPHLDGLKTEFAAVVYGLKILFGHSHLLNTHLQAVIRTFSLSSFNDAATASARHVSQSLFVKKARRPHKTHPFQVNVAKEGGVL